MEVYVTARGECPVEEYLSGLTGAERATIAHSIELLRVFGVQLRMPTVRHITGDLWELRPGAHRLFYCIAAGRRCILLSGYRKQGQRTPQREIARARRYMADWWEREGNG